MTEIEVGKNKKSVFYNGMIDNKSDVQGGARPLNPIKNQPASSRLATQN
ncbi:hypothetical protein [Bacillus sp. AFS015802]|nr:hypothetical protein [Bacillus sp. AFS015802]